MKNNLFMKKNIVKEQMFCNQKIKCLKTHVGQSWLYGLTSPIHSHIPYDLLVYNYVSLFNSSQLHAAITPRQVSEVYVL